MNTPPDDEMPKDLDRVYAALNATHDPAPEELLQRILASRAAGERVILRTRTPTSSRFRKGLFRWAIAAALGLVALGTWSRWARSHSAPPRSTVADEAQLASFDVFSFGNSAYAQEAPGPQQPQYEPMTFDLTRLHPMSVRYVRRFFYNGKQNDVDSSRTFRLVKGAADEWRIIVERHFSDTRLTMNFGDTLRISGPKLTAVSESYASRNTFGEFDAAQVTFGDKTAAMHTEGRYIIVRASPGFGEVPSDPAERARRGVAATAPTEPAARTNGKPDTVTFARDTVLPIGHTNYPRLTNVKSDAELLFKLMAVKFNSTWKGSVVTTYPGGLLMKDQTREFLIPVDLEVAGTVRCTARNMTTECWRIVRTRPASTTTFLVRKRDGLTILQRTESTVDGKKFVMEMMLIGEQ